MDLVAKRIENIISLFWMPSPSSKSLCCSHLCLTLCNLMDCSSPGSSVHGISQPRILESIVNLFSRVKSKYQWRNAPLKVLWKNAPCLFQILVSASSTFLLNCFLIASSFLLASFLHLNCFLYLYFH